MAKKSTRKTVEALKHGEASRKNIPTGEYQLVGDDREGGPAMTAKLSHPDYPGFLAGLKERIVQARTAAARAVNRELILLYWDIGQGIVEKQQAAGWGDSVVERLSADLRAEFPDMSGFSARNLRDMKRFFLAYSDEAAWRQPVAALSKHLSAQQRRIWPQAVAKMEEGKAAAGFLRQLVAEIPWGHHRPISNKLGDPAGRPMPGAAISLDVLAENGNLLQETEEKQEVSSCPPSSRSYLKK